MHPKTYQERRPEWSSHCAWCNEEFDHIIELLAHADERHVTASEAPPAA
jgi:hypothetical protein